MLRIAVDIDNTLYDTERCTQDVYDEANQALSDMGTGTVYTHSLYTRVNEKLDAVDTWFNPKYLIPEAVATLKELGNAAELYICTARYTDLSKYDALFADSGLRFAGILQRDKHHGNKAIACMQRNIDVLIDDDTMNLMYHYNLLKGNKGKYKTHFVLYTGCTGGDDELHPEYYVKEHADTVSVMSDWRNFGQIIERLRKERHE